MRNGWWLLLDELNLAPPDVLEALNRVLDDNRELFIAETGEIIKAHPRFQLFAAQNVSFLQFIFSRIITINRPLIKSGIHLLT